MLGISGAAELRFAVVTPNERSCPDRTNGSALGMFGKLRSTTPLSKSGIALPVPL